MSSAQTRRHRWAGGHWRTAGALAFAAAALAACAQEAPIETPEPRTVLVETVSAQGSTGGLVFAGELRAADRATLGFEMSGLITSINFDLGDAFAAGDVLAELDDRTLRLDLNAARADLEDSRAALINARLDYERQSSLAGTGAVSQAAIDRAKAHLDGAQARLEALSAQVAAARERLEHSRLYAPFDGEIVERLSEPAQFVSAGQPVFRIIGEAAGLEAVFSAPERRLQSVAVGDDIDVIELGGRRGASRATVIEVGSQANSAGLFPITVSLADEAKNRFRPGQSVEVRFTPGNQGRQTVVIPVSSYVRAADGDAFVFAIAADGQSVQRTQVTLGEIGSNGVEVLGGLEPGETIVVKGADLLKDGEEISPVAQTLARYNH